MPRLVSDIVLRTPCEELEQTFEKQARGLEHLASEERLRRLTRAFAIARERLESVMRSGNGAASVAQEPEPPAVAGPEGPS